MYTSAEIALLRSADPGVVIPGIDTADGNPLAASSLTPVASMPSSGSAFYYIPAENEVVVNQAGAVLSGYNFGSATISIRANNVTIKDSTFQAGAGEWYAIVQAANAGGAVIRNNTFNGGSASNPLPMTAFIDGTTSMSVLNNSFLNAPGNAINTGAGTVSGNFISGGGFSSAGKHPDSIWVPATTGPLTISNNFVDATWAVGATGDNNGETAYALMLTLVGNISDVTVSNNILLGGSCTIGAVDPGSTYSYSNVNIAGNYLGFAQYGAFYPGTAPGVSETDNTVFDFTNPIYSQRAWAAYLASGIKTPNLVVASAASQRISASSGGSTTLYGGWGGDYLSGSYKETVFIGGAGVQYLEGGTGANVFTYLAFSDSTPQQPDAINYFDPAKDVIDLSAIDVNPASEAAQNFTFIGTAPFTGAGSQVRFQQNPTDNQTLVEATMAGDSSPDLYIRLTGLVNLTAANFALTAAQSTADLAAGAALQVSTTRAAVGSAVEDTYTNVQGKSYSSYNAIYGRGLEAEDLNLSSSSNQLNLYGNALTINLGSGAESVQIGTSSGTSTFSLGRHSNETTYIGAAGAETFGLGSGFGNETITGFAISGAHADTINFATSAFSYLSAGMTQAQDLAAVLAHASSSGSNLIIPDTSGDILTLNGLTAASIIPSQFHFA